MNIKLYNMRKRVNNMIKKVKNEKTFYIIFDYIKKNNIEYTINNNGVFFSFNNINMDMLNNIILIIKQNKIKVIKKKIKLDNNTNTIIPKLNNYEKQILRIKT
jgi:hypothetical protein